MQNVFPYRNSRLTVIVFATALIVLWENAAMAMSLKSGQTSVTRPLPVDKRPATSSPLIAASGDAHLGAVGPDALLVSGPGELMSEHVAAGRPSAETPSSARRP
jgi:hypothetical protein